MHRTIELLPGESVTLADGTVVRAVRLANACSAMQPADVSLSPRDLVSAIVARGISQVQVAKQTGISQCTLSKVAQGKRLDMQSSNYRALLALLNSLPEA